MALGNYLGGIVVFLIGLFLMVIGIIDGFQSYNSGVCTVLVFIGLILMLIGGFYSKTSYRSVPQKVEIISERKPDRYCPNCGRSIPFDANICPYCSKKF